MLVYEVAGQGVPIVLLHAFPLSHAMWKDSVAPLARLGRVIAPDLPGFGRSPRQPTPSIPEMALSVVAMLDALAAREPAVVAGLSMGGYVAFELLRQFPARVRALGLFSTRAGPDTTEQRQTRRWMAEQIRREGLEPFTHTILPKLLGKTTLATQQSVVEQVSWLIMANKPDGAADALVAMSRRQDSTPLLSTIRIPTLILTGAEDAIIPAEEPAAMQRAIQGARLERIDGAGHLVNLEQPQAFLTVWERFLKDTALA